MIVLYLDSLVSKSWSRPESRSDSDHPTRSIFLKSFRQARHRPAETISLHGNCTALFLHRRRRRSNSITRNGKLQRGGSMCHEQHTDFFTFFIEDPRMSKAFARKRRPLKDVLFVRECKRTTRLLSYCGLSDSQCDGPRSSAIPRELYGPLHETRENLIRYFSDQLLTRSDEPPRLSKFIRKLRDYIFPYFARNCCSIRRRRRPIRTTTV